MLGSIKANVLYPAAEHLLGRDIRTKLRYLETSHSQSPEERRESLVRKLHSVLIEAGRHVPYYHDLFRQIRFSPDAVLEDLSALQELPYLTKDIIREQGGRLVHQHKVSGPLHSRKTGGSTGLSTIIYYDQDALDWTAAENLFVLGFTGRRHKDTEVHLSSDFQDKVPFKARLVEKVKCWAMNRRNILTCSMDDGNLARIWDQLQTLKPFLVQGHPSTVYALSLYLERHGLYGKGVVRAFESTGETIDRRKKEHIEKFVGCKVYNRFGNAEFGVVAHSRDDFERLEVIDAMVYPEAFSLGNGLDEIVLTGLTNFAMPLIRYRTGDVGRLSFDSDKWWISDLTGRIHDLVEIDGTQYPTHYIQDVLDRAGGVDEFQIVNKGSGQQVIRLVPNASSNKPIIEEKIRRLFGEKIKIEYTTFDGLTLQGWRSKFRYVVNQ